ncbi:ATP-binding protein [Diplocloster agilis]|uniref:ATP-binding protein n=1 Tax=Diplocloster agilis TaxID=2850323 RepID=UPI000821C212|nr:transporter substrate-binding domain-containing protein [Suonthocola fibrivorans]MCU6736669.1 transporter substrate-binding domain-containing protein [Suonthocola fibrivorans]SCJ92712.1 Sensory/regulatory protein RpfC [uncultured Clostridium sp.]
MLHTKKDKTPQRKLWALFIALLTIVSFLLPIYAEGAENRKVLQIPFPEVEGFSMTDEKGNRSGIVVDYLNEIAKYTGWAYEFTETTGEDMLNDFLDGKYDLMGGTYYSESMEQYFGYPEYSCGYSKSVLLARREDDDIRGYDMKDLDGKTIGVAQRATENVRRLREFLSANALDCTIREYLPEEVAAGKINQDLKSGVIDLKLGNVGDDVGEFNAVAYFDAQPHYIVTQPGNQELLEQLNWAMENILSANPNFAVEVYDRYFKDLGVRNLTLTAEEKAYIEQKGSVTVAVPHYYHPFYCIDSKDSNHEGIIPELLERIERLYDLEFSFVCVDSYAQALELVKQGAADMAGFYFTDVAEEMQNELVQTQSYASLNDLVVRNKSVTYPGEGLTCGILEGRHLPSYASASSVKYYATIEEVVDAVNNGEVDFACGLFARLEQLLQDNIYSNVVPVTLSENRMEVSFAMPMPANPQLLTIINKGINSLSEKDKLAIIDHNLVSIGNSSTSLKRLIETNPILSVCVMASFLIVTMAAVAIIASMRIRAVNMEKERDKAAAENKAKSEFLSRMSHEIRTPMNAIVGTTALMSMDTEVPERMKSSLKKLDASSQYLLSLINDILDMSRIDNGMLAIAQEDFSLNQMLDELCSIMQIQAQRQQITLTSKTKIKHSDLIGDSIRLKQVLMNLLSNAIKFTSANGTVQLSVTETESDKERAAYLFQVTDTGSGINEEDQERIFKSFEQVGTNHMRSQGTGLGLPISRSIVHMMGGTLKVKSKPEEGSEFYFRIFLPYGKPKEAPALRDEEATFAGTHFLLAEDNPINAEIATDLLSLRGAHVVLAEDGLKAVECFKQSAPGYFTLILMDLQMPNMGGLEATKCIRDSDHPDAAAIPIIALTANSFQEDREMAREAGMNDFLAKPLDINRVYMVLQEWVSKRTDQPT